MFSINTWKIIGRKKKKQRKHLKLRAWMTRYYRESVCAEVFLQWVCIAWQNKTENWQSGSEQKQSENQELLVEEKEAVSFSGILQTKQNKTQTQPGGCRDSAPHEPRRPVKTQMSPVNQATSASPAEHHCTCAIPSLARVSSPFPSF